MTTTTSTPAVCPPAPTGAVDATVPRKRRRRAPATGAADDCFACLDRKSKCDRRRPYCTPCLDQGKDCSGYKTKLTWGVGVASRGKLRGLALPVVEKAAPAAAIPRAHRARSSIGGAPEPRSQTQTFQTSLDGQGQHGTGTFSPTMMPTNYDFVGIGGTAACSAPPISPVYQTWPVPSIPTELDGSPKQKAGLRRRSLRPLDVPLASSYQDFGVSKSAPFFGGYNLPSYTSPIEYPHTPDDFTFTAGVLPYYKNFSSEQSIAISPHDCIPFHAHGPDVWPGGSLSSSLSSNHSSNDFLLGNIQPSDNVGVTDPVAVNLDVNLGGEMSLRTNVKAEETEDVTITPRAGPESIDPMEFSVGQVTSRIALSLSRSLPSLSIGKTPRLQYLINYYDTAIAPFIVAFDGPTNPYRTHILRLAVRSETLQHAIAALSSSNLRTREYNNALSAHRRSPALIEYTSSDVPDADESLPNRVGPRDSGLTNKSPSPEELYHKRASVQSLNAQLADPLRMKDDCILATLLILCLYHVCDTGVAKFRTQFEGVKKILGMRNSGTKNSGSDETGWLTTMFTWFDAMTATVNDREGQLQGAHLDMAAFSGNEWALENLAGCDGQLFKIIAKLGRLNMLSQGRQVENRDPPRPLMTCNRAASISRQDYYSMNHNRFDGNGWASLLEDEELMTDRDDSQVQFWREWSQIRTELQAWELESPTNSDPLSSSPNIDRGDLLHISESFRHSALIYTERLAQPHLRSLHPNFQNLVAQAIYHMTSVKSDVFLLWPLFITGTECVDEHHRSLIRQRCLHIQKDSGFFNNISVLELLEKIWRENKHGQQEGMKTVLNANGTENTTACGQKFRWRKAMERPDGEYIVI